MINAISVQFFFKYKNSIFQISFKESFEVIILFRKIEILVIYVNIVKWVKIDDKCKFEYIRLLCIEKPSDVFNVV